MPFGLYISIYSSAQENVIARLHHASAKKANIESAKWRKPETGKERNNKAGLIWRSALTIESCQDK